MVASTAAAFSAAFPLLRHTPVIPTAGRNLIQILLFSFSPFLPFSRPSVKTDGPTLTTNH
jgi:hypothetical protein